MALEITKQTIEVETCAGSASAQTLARAETLVPGAGREAIEVLLAEAEVSTQAAYRQGDETAPRALSARTGLSRTFEIEGVEPQMAAEVCARVEHVEAKYENGRMVFLVTVDMAARATGLRSVEVLTGVTGLEDVQQDLREICSEKTAAQTKATALLREEVPLPAAMDARTSLMDWGGVWVDALLAFPCGLLVKLAVSVTRRVKINAFFTNFLACMLLALGPEILICLGVPIHADKMIIGTIMLLVPGIAITNGMRDVLVGDFLTALTRFAEVVIVAMGITTGVAAAITVTRFFLGGLM